MTLQRSSLADVNCLSISEAVRLINLRCNIAVSQYHTTHCITFIILRHQFLCRVLSSNQDGIQTITVPFKLKYNNALLLHDSITDTAVLDTLSIINPIGYKTDSYQPQILLRNVCKNSRVQLHSQDAYRLRKNAFPSSFLNVLFSGIIILRHTLIILVNIFKT